MYERSMNSLAKSSTKTISRDKATAMSNAVRTWASNGSGKFVVQKQPQAKSSLSKGSTVRYFSSHQHNNNKNPHHNHHQHQHNHEQHARRTAYLSASVVPITILAWGVAGWIMGDQQLAKNEALRKEFLQSTRLEDISDDYDNDSNNDDSNIENESSSISFYCVVRRTKGLTHCLTGVKVGDVVEVLQEGVGPNQEYNLCRLPPPSPIPPQSQTQQQYNNNFNQNDMKQVNVYGWFPTRGLQKLDEYHAMAEKQLQELKQEAEE